MGRERGSRSERSAASKGVRSCPGFREARAEYCTGGTGLRHSGAARGTAVAVAAPCSPRRRQPKSGQPVVGLCHSLDAVFVRMVATFMRDGAKTVFFPTYPRPSSALQV